MSTEDEPRNPVDHYQEMMKAQVEREFPEVEYKPGGEKRELTPEGQFAQDRERYELMVYLRDKEKSEKLSFWAWVKSWRIWRVGK